VFNWFKKLKPSCKCCGGTGKLYKLTIFSDYIHKECPVCSGEYKEDYFWDDDCTINRRIIREFANGWKRKNYVYKLTGMFSDSLKITQEK